MWTRVLNVTHALYHVCMCLRNILGFTLSIWGRFKLIRSTLLSVSLTPWLVQSLAHLQQRSKPIKTIYNHIKRIIFNLLNFTWISIWFHLSCTISFPAINMRTDNRHMCIVLFIYKNHDANACLLGLCLATSNSKMISLGLRDWIACILN